ncbi:MAG: tetratricopeptide repeat protein [Verrucomicrobia bacterium]|nr:tetratricopeptide repeat protein [Verrucomicrobiota bacterium]
MTGLFYPDNLHHEAAIGWLMLGDARSALEEIARLTPTARTHPEVLEVEWSAHAEAKQWAEAFAAAERLVALAPERSTGWIHRSYALRRMPGGGLPRAWEALRPAFDRFPKQYLIPYNLACYAAQLGHLEEAWEWLQRSRGAAPKPELITRQALDDPDLEPLWARLQAPSPQRKRRRAGGGSNPQGKPPTAGPQPPGEPSEGPPAGPGP